MCKNVSIKCRQTSTTSTNPTHAVSTWPPHTPEVAPSVDRPHTISSAYEKGHQRPALTVYTFQNPEIISEAQKSPANVLCRPPLPIVIVFFLNFLFFYKPFFYLTALFIIRETVIDDWH